MGDLEQPLWRRAAAHTLHASLLMKAELEERLQEGAGILLADHEALLNVAHAAEPLRMSEIADRLVLSRGGTTKVVDRLEEMGLVSRLPDPGDRRATVVEITPAGREMLDRAREIIDDGLIRVWSAGIGDDEARVVIGVMERVMAAYSKRPG